MSPRLWDRCEENVSAHKYQALKSFRRMTTRLSSMLVLWACITRVGICPFGQSAIVCCINFWMPLGICLPCLICKAKGVVPAQSGPSLPTGPLREPPNILQIALSMFFHVLVTFYSHNLPLLICKFGPVSSTQISVCISKCCDPSHLARLAADPA